MGADADRCSDDDRCSYDDRCSDDYWCSDLLCEEQPPAAGCPCGDPVQGPTEIECHAQLDMGLRDEDIKALTLAWRQTMGAAQRAMLEHGAYTPPLICAELRR